MKVAIMQPYFFPYLGYFQLIASVDKFVVYDDVAFIKQGWINRNRIVLNGNTHTFTIPVKDISSFRLIKDTELHDRLYPVWRTKFLKTIESAYHKAPHFKDILQIVEKVLNSECQYISQLAVQSITEVCAYLGVSTQMILTSGVYGNEMLKGKDRVIDICKKELANTYINVPGGMDLYNREEFAQLGLEIKFIQPKLNPYPQSSKEFLPGLSMIDVLMCNSKENIQKMVTDYSLI